MPAEPENIKSTPEVFAFVPSYNHAPFIERCLKSIIKQSRKPAKLLIIDDGSKDDSPRIIERVLRDCPFPAELIVRENRGLCRTLNQGFEQSFGKYFAYLGSDDVWLPEFLANRVRLLEQQTNAVLAYGNAFLIDEEDRILESSSDYAAYKNRDARRMLLLSITPISSTVCYRRSALEKVRWNETARLEDYELYLKLSALGEFAFDSQTLAAWRWHGYNTSGDMPLMLREVIEAQLRNTEILNLNENELTEVQRELKLIYAENFARHGRKKEALKLTLENWRGASSPLVFGKTLFYLLIPQFVRQWRKNYNKQKSTRKYGVVRI